MLFGVILIRSLPDDVNHGHIVGLQLTCLDVKALKKATVKPRFKEVPRDRGNRFVISRVRYIEVLFHTLHYYWAEEYGSFYRGLRYIEVR